MRILYDHQIYVEQEYGGISRYFYELGKELKTDLHVDVENTTCLSNNVYTTDPIYSSKKFFPNNKFKGKVRLLKIINELNSKVKLKGSYDIFHPTYYDTYFLKEIKNRPFVITFYDLIHEKFAHKFDDLTDDKQLFEKRKKLLDKASKIIAISNSTKNDIIEVYKVPETKIEVVYLASSINPGKRDNEIPYDNYILYVGNRRYYKNFKLFIEAIAPLLIKEKGIKVICAGGPKFDLSEMNFFIELKIANQLLQLSINDHLLSTLYKKALFFVFPSVYEGFGIPVLEAFSCSCATLLSATSSLPEVGGDAALYFDPYDKDDILDKVTLLLYDSDLRDKLKKNGVKRLKLFSWLQTAKDHYGIYKSVL